MDFQTVMMPPGTRKETPEGYLQAQAAVGRVGVLYYARDELKGMDGLPAKKRIGVMITSQSLFDQETKDSLALKPLTLRHPGEDVTASNQKDYKVGTVGENIDRTDDEKLAARIQIEDADAVAKVKAGQLEQLSLGVYRKLEREAGTFQGDQYDYVVRLPQEVNHVALVERGRAGAGVRVFDKSGEDSEMNEDEIKQLLADELGKQQNTLVAGLASSLDAALKPFAERLDALDKKMGEGKCGSGKEEEDEGMGKKKDGKKAKTEDEIRAEVAADMATRADVLAKVKPLLTSDAYEAVKDGEISAIIRKALDGKVENLDGKSDDYLIGQLDSVSNRRAAQAQGAEDTDEHGFTKPKTKGQMLKDQGLSPGASARNVFDLRGKSFNADEYQHKQIAQAGGK